jgi:hypothetical protein
VLRLFAHLLAILLTLLSGCDRHNSAQHSDVSTYSSTAELDQSGNVRFRQPTSAELSELNTIDAKIAEIDRRYPRPEIPKGVLPSKAVRMLAPAIVELADGRRFHLDGVICSATGLEYLSRRIIDPETAVLVVPLADSTDQPIAADVWTLEESNGQTSYSSPVETALTSGWCDVQTGSSSRHKDRYAALVSAFTKERARAMSDVR